MSHRSWCYTLNNYTPADIAIFEDIECIRHVCGREVGETGTPHLQGVISFKTTRRLSAMKKIHPKAHWEGCRSIQHSIEYCKKEDDIIIDIDNGEKGKRTDLLEAIDTLKSGGLRAVAEEHPEQIIKYGRNFQFLKELLEDEAQKYEKLEVIVLWGEPGSGKTRRAREIDNHLYNVPPIINGNIWFNGYENQETVLFDDFYGEVPLSYILQLLDGYFMRVPTKGGFTAKKWKRVILTSNVHPKRWYRENWEALERRITEIIHL